MVKGTRLHCVTTVAPGHRHLLSPTLFILFFRIFCVWSKQKRKPMLWVQQLDEIRGERGASDYEEGVWRPASSWSGTSGGGGIAGDRRRGRRVGVSGTVRVRRVTRVVYACTERASRSALLQPSHYSCTKAAVVSCLPGG